MLPSLFLERMALLMGEDAARFAEWIGGEPVRGMRVNTLKTDAATLLSRYPETKPTPFCEAGYYAPPSIHPLTDPLHHAGGYYMQEPSAMSAVTALAPRPGEWVLDTCAAPGGKSTQIASAMQGEGLLWCNEYVAPRAKILSRNLERLGVRNAVVSRSDVPSLTEQMPGWFDAVLVDAPCSGEGMFRKEPEALAMWSMENIRLCAARQQEILDAAAVAVRPGGRLVYSTCTFAPEENECQIGSFLLRHPDFSLVPLDEPFGRPGFSGNALASFTDEPAILSLPLERTRRVLPWQGGEGHFVCLLKREGEMIPCRPTGDAAIPKAMKPQWDGLMDACFVTPPAGIPAVQGDTVRLLPAANPAIAGKSVVAAGIAAATVCKNRLEPCHALFVSAKPQQCRSVLMLSADDPRILAFLHGEPVAAPDCRSWTAVAVEGVIVGFGKASGGVLKNHYPKGLRLL